MINSNKFMLGILALLLVVSFASALQVSPSSASLSVTQGSSVSTVLTLTNEEAVNITGVSLSASPAVSGISFSSNSSNVQIDNGTSKAISVTYSTSNSLSANNYLQTITISYNNGSAQTKTVPVTLTVNSGSVDFCEGVAKGTNISVSDFSINNNGEGDDEEWFFLDDVEIEVEVSNDGNKKVSDVEVEIAIYSGNEDVTDDFDFDDEKIDLGSISDDDEETATFTMKNIPVDMAEGSYTVYVKATAKNECDYDSTGVEVTNPFGDGVIVNDGIISDLIEANAGSTIDEISFDATNLGDNKEDDVLITLYNRELGINEKYHINDLGAGDSEAVYFSLINIPSNAQSKVYEVEVKTYFDYDDGDVLETSSYDQDSEDDLEDDYNTFSFSIKVLGSNQSVTPVQQRPTVTARLNSSAKVGENLVIIVSVRNNADKVISTALSAEGYDSWAQLSGISPASLILSSQNSGDSIITLRPTAEGQQTFNLKVYYEGQIVDQPVTVNVAPASSGVLSNVFGDVSKTTAYLILAIIVLIVIIILVLIIKAITSSSKKKDYE